MCIYDTVNKFGLDTCSPHFPEACESLVGAAEYTSTNEIFHVRLRDLLEWSPLIQKRKLECGAQSHSLPTVLCPQQPCEVGPVGHSLLHTRKTGNLLDNTLHRGAKTEPGLPLSRTHSATVLCCPSCWLAKGLTLLFAIANMIVDIY